MRSTLACRLDTTLAIMGMAAMISNVPAHLVDGRHPRHDGFPKPIRNAVDERIETRRREERIAAADAKRNRKTKRRRTEAVI